MSTRATDKTPKGPLFVWICGTTKAEFFSTTKKEDAVRRCKTAYDFIAKVRFNFAYSDATKEVESTEYPLAKAGGWQ